ncbi:MAG: hypothetical protein ACYC64_19865 [Armatimonadota bacterium]
MDNKERVGSEDRARAERFERNGVSKGPGAPKGNTNALKHGIYADRFLAAEERPIFDSIITQLYEDFVFNKSSDFIQVELVAVYFLKLGRAHEAGDWEVAERLDRMIRCHMRDLKTTKISREGTEAMGVETTPAEWATSLLEQLAEAEKAEAERLQAEAEKNGDGQSEPEKTPE